MLEPCSLLDPREFLASMEQMKISLQYHFERHLMNELGGWVHNLTVLTHLDAVFVVTLRLFLWRNLPDLEWDLIAVVGDMSGLERYLALCDAEAYIFVIVSIGHLAS